MIDVTDLPAITELTGCVPFDILVNNAGVDRPRKFLDAGLDDIDLLVDVNLRAVLHLCRLVVPGMVARDRGHVINISSIAGAYNFGGNAPYHATKAAVSMLSNQLRIDGLELPEARDIADAIAFAIAAPIAINIGHMEITPTLQVMGGLSTARPSDTA